MGTETPQRDLAVGLLALLAVGFAVLHAAGCAGNGAFFAALLAISLSALCPIKMPGHADRARRRNRTAMSGRAAIGLAASFLSCIFVVYWFGPPQRLVGLLLFAVGAFGQAVVHLQRATGMRRTRTAQASS